MNELPKLIWILVQDPRIWIIGALALAAVAFLMDEEQNSGDDED